MGVGEFVPGIFETLLKDESAGSARGEPSPCSQFGNVDSRGASGMAPALCLEPFPQLQREVELPPAVVSLLRLRGLIPVLPLLPQDGGAWNGSQGCWDPAGSRGTTWGRSLEQGIHVGSSWEDRDPSQCPLFLKMRQRKMRKLLWGSISRRAQLCVTVTLLQLPVPFLPLLPSSPSPSCSLLPSDPPSHSSLPPFSQYP